MLLTTLKQNSPKVCIYLLKKTGKKEKRPVCGWDYGLEFRSSDFPCFNLALFSASLSQPALMTLELQQLCVQDEFKGSNNPISHRLVLGNHLYFKEKGDTVFLSIYQVQLTWMRLFTIMSYLTISCRTTLRYTCSSPPILTVSGRGRSTFQTLWLYNTKTQIQKYISLYHNYIQRLRNLYHWESWFS